MLDESVLKGLIKTFENEFPEAKLIRPRLVSLQEVTYINDEEIDKADELEEDEKLVLEVLEEDITKETKEIEPNNTFMPIVAVDTSSVKLGETNKGILAAIRVGIFIQNERETSGYIYGPYVVHITDGNKQSIYDYLRENLLGIKKGEAPKTLTKMIDRIRNLIERISQTVACSMIKNGLVLWDGSLTGGTIDTPKEVIENAIRIAHLNGNSIIAISKKSWLRLMTGEQLIGLLDNIPKTCFIDVHDKLYADKSRFLGRVYVAKFTPDGFSFRVDVAASSEYTNEDVLSLLAGNSAFYNGYPETLSQAHIHCYFTPSEVLALQNYAINKYNLEIVRTFDIRRHLFTTFGREVI
jgi:hypothetical protein